MRWLGIHGVVHSREAFVRWHASVGGWLSRVGVHKARRAEEALRRRRTVNLRRLNGHGVHAAIIRRLRGWLRRVSVHRARSTARLRWLGGHGVRAAKV